MDYFTNNKQVVRDYNYNYIQRNFKERENDLVYMGLPAPEMRDIICWKNYIKKIYAIEIGRQGIECAWQHNIFITAFKEGLINKLTLLRGDIDEIIINGSDDYGNLLEYPFDIVNLDYCSGIIYRPFDNTKAIRVEALRNLIERQAEHQKSFMLIISVNLDHYKPEICKTLELLKDSLGNPIMEDIIRELLRHEHEEARLKVYVPYLIWSLANNFYKLDTNAPIHYEGNKKTRMMNFSFFLKYDRSIYAPRINFNDIRKIINLDMLQVIGGTRQKSNIKIPKAV